MDYLRTFNVTILACLLILSGCLGSTIDDTEAAEGDDSTSDGTTTVINNYYNNTTTIVHEYNNTTTVVQETPDVMVAMGNGTNGEGTIIINQAAGETIFINQARAQVEYFNPTISMLFVKELGSYHSLGDLIVYSNCTNGLSWETIYTYEPGVGIEPKWLPGYGLECDHALAPDVHLDAEKILNHIDSMVLYEVRPVTMA